MVSLTKFKNKIKNLLNEYGYISDGENDIYINNIKSFNYKKLKKKGFIVDLESGDSFMIIIKDFYNE